MLKAEKPRLPPNVEAMKLKSLEVFDQLAQDGKLGAREFSTVSQSMIKPMLNMPLAMVGSSQGPLGAFGPDLAPALERALQKFDYSGLDQLLCLVHEIIDKDKNGTVERKEVKKFWDLVGAAQAPSQEGLTDVAFADANGDGKISLDEFTGIFEKIIQIVGKLVSA